MTTNWVSSGAMAWWRCRPWYGIFRISVRTISSAGLIERFAEHRPRLEDAAAGGKGIPVSSVRIRPPLPKPGNIDCMALNYREDGARGEPALINAFHKSPTCIIGNDDSMVLPDVPATVFEGEAEVAW